MTPVQTEWLWPSWIPLGKLTVLAGHPGLGKSTLTLELTARLSTGRAMPGCETASLPPADTVLVSSEDGTADTIVPRLDRYGADRSRVTLLQGYRDGRERALGDLRQPHAVAALRAQVGAVGARLVVIDPLSAYVGGVDSHRNAEIRGLLRPLAEVAEEHQCAVVLVEHLNKSTAGQILLHRVGGSIGIVGAARSVLFLTRWADARVLWSAKNNLASHPEPLAMRLDRDGGILWAGAPEDFDPEAAVAEQRPRPRRPRQERTDDMRRALTDVLRQPRSKTDAVKAASKQRPGRKADYLAEFDRMHREGLIRRSGRRGRTELYVMREPEPLEGSDTTAESEVPVPSEGER